MACFGVDYYVDATGGNDANSGRGTTSAWKTIRKVNSYTGFAAGDRILLKRGQTWREQLIVPRGGAAGNPIVFGAYGSGARPKLRGSALVLNWTSAGTNKWRASLGAAPNQVFFDGLRGTKQGGLSYLDRPLEWSWSSGVLYVYATSDPDGLYRGPGIEASLTPATRSYGLVHLQGRSYVTIEGLEVSQSASFGVYLKPAGQYLTVRDCEVSHSLDGGIVAPNSGGTAVAQVTIENCLVHHNNGGFKEGDPGVATYHEGLTIELVDGFTIRGCQVYANYMEGVNFKRGARNGVIENCRLYANDLINQYLEGATNVEIRYNRIYDCSYNAGIELGLETSTYHNDNIRIHHNLFWNNAGGVSFWAAGGATAQTRNIQIHNNTFYGNWEAVRWKSGATDNYSGANAIKNNLFWQKSTSNWALRDYTASRQALSRTAVAYNVFQQGAATDTTGSNALLITDPYFVNAAALDFHLRSGSRGIDSGTGLGMTRDFDGNRIPQGAGPDRGAYEFGSTTTTTAYTLSTSATNGTITRTPNQTSYTAGTTVSLQATPNSGYAFSGWSGALTGTANPATLVMDSNKSVTANFTSTGSTGTTTKIVGNTTVFSTSATTLNRRAAPYTMPEAGRLQSISIYHQGGVGQVILAVYADSSGRPGTRLGVTSATTVRSTQGWQTVALQSPVSVSAGQKVWLAWVFQYYVKVRATAGTPGRAEANATWSGGMPSAFGTASVANYIYSIYATYTTTSTTTTAMSYASAVVESDSGASPETTVRTHGKPTTAKAAPGAQRTYAEDASGIEAVADVTGEISDQSGLLEEMDSLVLDHNALTEQAGLSPGQPATVSDGQGNVWAVWHAGAAGERQVYAARLAPDAAAYTDTVQLSQAEGDHYDPSLAIDAAGTLYAVWQEKTQGAWDVCLSTSVDGAVWSTPKQIADSNDNQTNPAIAAGSSESSLVTVVWQEDRAGNQDIFAARSADAFATTEVFPVTSDDADQTEPAVAVAGDGTIFVLWTDARNGSTDLYGAASNDGPWTNVPVVDTDTSQSAPALAVSRASPPSNRGLEARDTVLHVAWVDDLGGDPDIFYAAAPGLPAGPLVGVDLIDDTSGADQEAPAIIVDARADGTDRVFVCWQDRRNVAERGDSELYFAEVSAGSPAPNVRATDSN